MINLNSLPCITCENFGGVSQPDGTENTEFIYCAKAKKHDAQNLLEIKKVKISCAEYSIDVKYI